MSDDAENVQVLPKHPMQPVYLDERGVARFKPNRLVRYLLDNGGLDMNDLAIAAATHGIFDEDQSQFAQLIGYSVSGFGDLDYASSREIRKADKSVAKLLATRTGATP